MSNKLLFSIIVILVPFAVISFSKKETNFNLPTNHESQKIKVKENDGSITKMDLETYVIGVVAAEMPASFHEEALKAQAVCSRSYAYYKIKNSNKEYDISTTINDQGYISIDEMKKKWGSEYEYYLNKITNAVNSTKDEIITYNGDVILAYYFSMSNGYTEDSLVVFNEDSPYLESVESGWDNESLNNFEFTVRFSKVDFCQKLNINCQNIFINSIEKTHSNRVNSIIINNKSFSGIEIRNLLNLRSTDFSINVEKNNINITTYGYGHGVGMSQYGANGMAKEGKNYVDILNYYYNDIEISKI